MATSTIPRTYGLLCFAQGGTPSSAQGGAQSSAQPSLPEIHLNIWEQEPNRKSKNPDSLLDIGIMLDLNDPTTSIELIFPEKIDLASVQDLSTVLSQPNAIPAIFNESWAVTSVGKETVVSDPAEVSRSFAIVSVENAIKETRFGGYDALSIAIPSLISSAKGVAQSTKQKIERVYVRFRLLKFKRQFYCVGAGHRSNDWWQPSWQKTEDIDFRLNVRRGAPPSLEKMVGRFLEFSKVHLFLMRARDKDIVFHDKLFKASRSLEDEDFWAQYSIIGTSTAQETSLKRVKGSLGYHWKSNGTGHVKEFGTLARFKVVEFGVGKFVVLAIVIGASGSMLWDGVKSLHGLLFPPSIVQAQAPALGCREAELITQEARCAEERKLAPKVVGQANRKKEEK